MSDCLLPAGVHEPDGFARAYIVGAQGRFYRTATTTVIYEAGGAGVFQAVVVPGGSEVATSTTAGLPTMTLRWPYTLPDGTPIVRRGIVEERGPGRWIPSVVIVADPRRGTRLVHGWIPRIDLVAIGQSAIAANALQYDIAVQRCAQQAAQAAADASASTHDLQDSIRRGVRAGLQPGQVITTDAGLSIPLDIFGAKGGAGDEEAPPPPAEPTVTSGMGVAIFGTIAVVGLLGLVVWAAGK